MPHLTTFFILDYQMECGPVKNLARTWSSESSYMNEIYKKLITIKYNKLKF